MDYIQLYDKKKNREKQSKACAYVNVLILLSEIKWHKTLTKKKQTNVQEDKWEEVKKKMCLDLLIVLSWMIDVL